MCFQELHRSGSAGQSATEQRRVAYANGSGQLLFVIELGSYGLGKMKNKIQFRHVLDEIDEIGIFLAQCSLLDRVLW